MSFSPAEWSAELEAGAARMNASLARDQLTRMISYLELLHEANAHVNLTSVEPADFVELHLIDSLTVLDNVRTAPEGTVLDIGSGAGLPGIPLAIALPERSFVLLEANGKKIAFIQSVLKRLELSNCSSVNGRAEELARDSAHRARYACAVTRAFGSLPLAMEISAGFMGEQGIILAMRGPEGSKEAEQARDHIGALGCTLDGVTETALPKSGALRSIVKVRRTGQLPDAVPRSWQRLRRI